MSSEIKLERLWAFEGTDITEIPFMFRWLLFIDQCHDFLEKADRNKWRTPQEKHKKAYDNIVESYQDDVDWLITTLNLNTTLQNVNNTYPIPDVNAAQNTSKLLYFVDIQLKRINIEAISSSEIFREGGSCSSSLKSMIQIVNSRLLRTVNTYNLTVDADNSSINYAALILFLCDEISRTGDQKTLKIWTTKATGFDSASGSTVINHFKKIEEALPLGRGMITSENNTSMSKIKITYNNVTLLEFEYINSGQQLKLISIFGKIIPDGKETILKQKASVSEITSNSLDDPSNHILMWFKTIGDLGQICIYYKLTGGGAFQTPSFFITFDKICSRISSLFLPYTMFEDKSSVNVISPITFFVKKGEVREITEAAGVLTGMKRTRFGKSNNKIKDLSYDDLKNKLKTVGINVTKINTRGKKVPLTKKEMQQKALMFKKLQLRAKRHNIKLMYKSKRGYVYKTYKRLTNELNRKLGKTSFG